MEPDQIVCSPSPLDLEALILSNFSLGSLTDFSNMSEDSALTNFSESSRIPAAIMVPTGIMLYTLSLLTFVGNAMVLHAIRTDKRLQTVSFKFPNLLGNSVKAKVEL